MKSNDECGMMNDELKQKAGVPFLSFIIPHSSLLWRSQKTGLWVVWN
jgi:hypothetical protein